MRKYVYFSMLFMFFTIFAIRLTKEDIRNFSLSKGANFSEEEINFTYDFIKKNWKDVLKNPNIFDIDRYKNHYKPENFPKIKQVFNEYFQKFNSFLK